MSAQIISKMINETHWPVRGLVIDVVTYPHWYSIRIYRDHFDSQSNKHREAIAVTITNILEKLKLLGIPCYLEVFDKLKAI